MPVESAADRAVFVDPDEFGTAAIYTLAGGGASAVNGIFDRPYSGVGGGEVAMASSDPTFLMREADLPAGAGEGDTLTVGAVAWTVRVIEPDGAGMATLQLEGTG